MQLEVIILAAGQGTRMKSSLPKVLHPLAGRPLLEHVIETAISLKPAAVHAVIGHGAEQVQQQLADFDVNWVIQHEQLGTGHGVLQALPFVSPDSAVLVLYGDVPLIGSDTLAALVAMAGAGPALLTAQVADSTGYGRILRDAAGALVGVVEHKDATEEQRGIDEINTGFTGGSCPGFSAIPAPRWQQQQTGGILPAGYSRYGGGRGQNRGLLFGRI